MDIIIVGAGIGGLTTALELHAAQVNARIRVFESVPVIKPVGVGINLFPHATRSLAILGLLNDLRERFIETTDFVFYRHNGQFVYSEPGGLKAGYSYPHFSCHRGELQEVLIKAVRERLGPESVILDHRCVGIEQDASGATANFQDANGRSLRSERGDIIIAADGILSNVRKQFYPDEGSPVFHGINMWRGLTRGKPFLNGKSAARIGGLMTTHTKLVLYPIKDNIDDEGNQLLNWVAEVVTDKDSSVDWNKPGKLESFYPLFKDWSFDWVDAAAILRNSDFILEYPMVDRDPVSRWTFGRVALLGDAAHPMYPRGGNGGAQSILDAGSIAKFLKTCPDPLEALRLYEAERLPKVNAIVLENRVRPPDLIIDTVERLSGGKKIDKISDLISNEDLKAISDSYKKVASFDLASVNREP